MCTARNTHPETSHSVMTFLGMMLLLPHTCSVTFSHIFQSTHAHTGSTSAHVVATVTASAWTFRAKDVSFLSGVKNRI